MPRHGTYRSLQRVSVVFAKAGPKATIYRAEIAVALHFLLIHVKYSSSSKHDNKGNKQIMAPDPQKLNLSLIEDVAIIAMQSGSEQPKTGT